MREKKILNYEKRNYSREFWRRRKELERVNEEALRKEKEHEKMKEDNANGEEVTM